MKKKDIEIGGVYAASLESKVAKAPYERYATKLERVRVVDLNAPIMRRASFSDKLFDTGKKGIEVETLDETRTFFGREMLPPGQRHVLTNLRALYGPWDEYEEAQRQEREAKEALETERAKRKRENAEVADAINKRQIACGLMRERLSGRSVPLVEFNVEGRDGTLYTTDWFDFDKVVELCERIEGLERELAEAKASAARCADVT